MHLHRRYHHGDLRVALLDLAARTLRERGVDALSLRELARELCVSHTAPSRHFKDKRALLDALALDGFARLGELLAAADRTEGDFRQRFSALSAAYLEFATAEPRLLELMFAGKHEPGASEELVAAGHAVVAPMLAVIAEGQRAGLVRTGDPEAVGLPAFAAVHGLASLLASGMVPADTRAEALTQVVDHTLRGLHP